MRFHLATVLLIACCVLPVTASAEEPAPQPDWFRRGVRALTFVDYQDPATSTQNPGNAFLGLYRWSGEIHLRPDVILDTPIVSWSFKPRVTASSRRWEDGVPDGKRDRDARFFVTEWMLQPKPTDELFISFGKEKLLWGSSFLVSPSNILFKDMEKVNPKTEVEGKYMARVVYLPTSKLTFNFIGRTQQEEDVFGRKSRPIRALKADYMGGSALVSVIGYVQQHERFRLGSFGQWTASDAVVLYYDGIVAKGSDARYPAPDPANPFGAGFVPLYEDSSRLFATVTAGGSYTFLSGETASLEFLYNGAGYDDAQARDYYALRRSAAGSFFDTGALGGLARRTLAESLFTGSPFLRKYYLMAQFQEREIKNVLDVMLRYVYGLEERAGQASTIVEWQMTKRLQLFNINTFAVGGGETEFNAIVSKSFLAGVEMHY